MAGDHAAGLTRSTSINVVGNWEVTDRNDAENLQDFPFGIGSLRPKPLVSNGLVLALSFVAGRNVGQLLCRRAVLCVCISCLITCFNTHPLIYKKAGKSKDLIW